VSVSDNSSVFVSDTTVSNNGGTGINVNSLSSLSLGGTVEVKDNGGGGISVGGASLLSGGGTITIRNNQGRGINVVSSTILLGGASIQIHDNGRQGVFLISSKGELRNAAINHNNLLGPQGPADPSPFPGVFQCGLCLHTGSDLFVSGVQITETQAGAHGVVIRGKSGLTANNVTIIGNAVDGIHAEAASGVLFFTSANNVSGNGGPSANCTDMLSWVGGDITGIQKPIKCTVLK
jgi:hypothetical protein